jgi:hypothetical protein
MTTLVSEQLRTFHITGEGLEDRMPLLTAAAVAAGRKLPAEDASYPMRIAPDYAVHPPGQGGRDGWSVPFAPEAGLALPLAALLHARLPLREQFLASLRQTAERLEDLLALDDSHAEAAQSPEAITATLGAGAASYLNVASLAQAIRRRNNPVHRMAPDRRERCRVALAALRAALAEAAGQPPFVVFQGGGSHPTQFGGEWHASTDPCASALDFCRRQLTAAEPALRALRTARLELEDAFDPASHPAILARFRWEAASPGELAALPPVIALLNPEQAGATPVRSLARVLRSRCPVQVLVPQPVLAPEDLRGDGPDFGLLGLAQRDAFVVQGSLARPDHLLPALASMAASLHPALAVIATPSAGGWEEAVLLPLARAWALYAFDPAAGRLQLEKVDDAGWTAAHAAALNPLLDGHFRVLPEEAGAEDPVELGQYLARFRDRAPLAVPYLAIQGAEAAETRVAVSRDLAEFCHDRLRAYDQLSALMAPPEAAPAAAGLSEQAAEAAMRQGAQLAVARIVALLTERR